MKKLLFILLVCLPVVAMAQQKVAVYVTSSSEEVDEAAKQIIGTELVSAIVKTNQYDAVERTSDFLQQINAEQGYQRSGNVDDQQISALGKQFGVDYVCVANLVVFGGGKYYIQARLIDVETATVHNVARETSSISDIDEMIYSSCQVASKLFNIKICDELPAKKPEPAKQPEPAPAPAQQQVQQPVQQVQQIQTVQPIQVIVQQAAPVVQAPAAEPEPAYMPTTRMKNVKIKNGVLKRVPEDASGTFIVGDDVEEIDKSAFEGCMGLLKVTIRNRVRKIREDAFHGCVNLTSITLPAGVQTVEGDAFAHCDNLQTVTIQNPNLDLHEDAFSKCDRLNTIYVPAGTGERFRKILPKKQRSLVVEK